MKKEWRNDMGPGARATYVSKELLGITKQIKHFQLDKWLKNQEGRVYDECLECTHRFIKTRGEEQTMCIPCLYRDMPRNTAQV